MVSILPTNGIVSNLSFVVSLCRLNILGYHSRSTSTTGISIYLSFGWLKYELHKFVFSMSSTLVLRFNLKVYLSNRGVIYEYKLGQMSDSWGTYFPSNPVELLLKTIWRFLHITGRIKDVGRDFPGYQKMALLTLNLLCFISLKNPRWLMTGTDCD